MRISGIADYAQDTQDQEHKIARRPVAATASSDNVPTSNSTESSQNKKPKPRFGALLNRTRSVRMEDGGKRSKPATPIRVTTTETTIAQYDGPSDYEINQAPLKTAPLHQDRSLRDMMNSGARNRSADRHIPSDYGHENVSMRRSDKASSQSLQTSSSSNSRETAGSHIFTNIKNTSSKAADGLGKAGKGFFGKIARSGSNTSKEDERYVPCVINLPLIQQTRITRIAQRLEDSKDKTEFWMPALPWRCIE